MTKYSATIVVRKQDSFTLESIDNIESDDLLHLLTQISFALMRIQKKEDEKRLDDDDIPF